jgi:hypothetical protein
MAVMPKMKRRPKELPDMTGWSDQQIHEFWKHHDSAEYWDQTKPVSVTATRRKSRVVTVRLNERDATALESIARQLDVDPITLIYRWIKEKLQAAAP